MDWLKELVPLLGTALGGPLGGAAASFIANKLGLDSHDVEAVSNALSGNKLTPEQITNLKLAELDFQKFLDENKIKLAALDVQDRSSARDLQKMTGSWVPGVMAVGVTCGFFGILISLMTSTLPPSDALLVMLGSLGTAWTAIVSFYFGSSQGSAQKSAIMERLAGGNK